MYLIIDNVSAGSSSGPKSNPVTGMHLVELAVSYRMKNEKRIFLAPSSLSLLDINAWSA